ncbi:unnamed protein product [Anisakis simplex]|uniref:Secreted protein n=1 Tax=Anisakis simplex TaxID=6269 RepID=A0A0M3K3I4_ANISI|nr:unnamed protein product [Anisakis simplex]
MPSGSVSSSTPSTATIHQQRKARRKWTSAFRVMQSLHRLKHPPMHHHQHHAHHEVGCSCLATSDFSFSISSNACVLSQN